MQDFALNNNQITAQNNPLICSEKHM